MNRRRFAFLGLLFLVTTSLGTIAACSSSRSPSQSTGGDAAGSDSGADVTRADSGQDGSDADTTDAGSTDVEQTDGGAGPITGLPPMQWTWVPFPNAKCRDGSSTGIGVNPSPGSTKLMIFLEGGGDCADPTSCSTNPSHFGASDFANAVASTQ